MRIGVQHYLVGADYVSAERALQRQCIDSGELHRKAKTLTYLRRCAALLQSRQIAGLTACQGGESLH
jgi:hypothetical protein